MNIDKVLANRNVFLTGSSGFIGTILLHRFLQLQQRNPESTQVVYCLLRKSKRFPTVSARLRQEVLVNEIFVEFADKMEDIIDKRIVAVEGDITHELMGVSQTDTLRIARNCVFIHCAADIQFKGHFNHSLKMNAFGTFQCLRLANALEAAAFVHASTLYVNSREHSEACVLERDYAQGFDACALFEEFLANDLHLTDARIAEVLSFHRKGQRALWPNTYTVSKCIGEKVAMKYAADFGIPLGVARLGIVSPVGCGPHTGWFMGTGGYIFIAIGCATGHLKWLQGTGNGRPDSVPADFTADALVAVCAKTLQCTRKATIYQLGVVQSQGDDFSVGKMFRVGTPTFIEAKLPNACKDPRLKGWISSPLVFFAYELLNFDLPLALATPIEWLICRLLALPLPDASTRSMNKWLRKLNFQRKARKKMTIFNENFMYFMEQRWQFDTCNVKALYASLDDASKKVWHFDERQVDLYEYSPRVVISVMRKLAAHKAMRRKHFAKQWADKQHNAKKKQSLGVAVLRSLSASLGGVSPKAMPQALATSMALSLSFFFVLLLLL